MKTGTIIGLLAVGGVGYLLYRQWKKTRLAVAAVAPSYNEQIAQRLSAQYNVPIATVRNLIQSISPAYGMPPPEVVAEKILAQA